MRSFQGGIEYSKYSGCVSSAYIALIPIKHVIPEFFKYLFKSDSYIKALSSTSNLVRDGQALRFENFSQVDLIIIPEEEQIAIAKFLDPKTAQIDNAISIKEKQIELLKERRQVLIHKAVTRGLNPNSLMRDSSVEWIGEIPAHWEVKKIKHVTSKIGSGITPSGGGTTYLESGIPLLRSQNILFGRIDFKGVAYISEKTHESMSNSQVRKGDVLLNITGGSIGRCHYITIETPLNVNQHVCIVRPTNEITTVFLNSLLASEVGQSQIWFYQQGGGREGLNFQAIKNFLIPLPPQSEQDTISEYIETITKKVSNALSIKEKEIEKLKEYKASLINSAVTGKIKVY
jgi:type I restriction enzyme, S subunit